MEDFILHFCARRYLCGPKESHHITDLSQGAMLVELAGVGRRQRYDRWYELLTEEIDLVATTEAGIVAVGRAVADHLERRGFPRPFTRVIHYSGQAARARSAGVEGHEERFEAFRDTVSKEDVMATAEYVLEKSSIPDQFREETLARLARRQLTASRKKLVFSYKVAFVKMRS
jgi:hypothetical protein